MFCPNYRVLITNESFPGDNVICLGQQLISIVKATQKFLPQHTWFVADVDAVGKNAPKFKGYHLEKLGTDSDLIEYCTEIEQFIWGDFLCINDQYLSQNFQEIELETEDLPFRSLNCKGVLFELKAFDTAFFEIFSEDLELMKRFSSLYNAQIEEGQPK